MAESPIVGIRFTPEDLALLEALASHEERSKSDVVRRAVRNYAAQLGVRGPKPKRKK